MRTKRVCWMVGALGLLVLGGPARAEDQPTEVTGAQVASEVAGKPVCRDAGVTVSFTTGSAVLDLNARGALNGVATWMKAKDDRTLHLQGYADPTGNAEDNLKLSENRADAVKDYLVSQGVAPEHIITAGRGEEADHLPANGRTVTFMACEPAAKVAEATPAPEETPPPPPAEEPVAEAPVMTPVPEAVPPPPAYEAAPKNPFYGSRFGWAVMVGGGYQDFTNGTMRNLTSGGGSWAARLVGGLNSFVGFEAAYVGSARNIQPLGLSSNSTLVSNGVEGTLRINVPIRMYTSLLEPYGFVGLGWSRYSINNYNAIVTSDFTTSADNVMTVPVGGGIAYAYKAFIVDARASWTPTYYNNLLTNGSTSGTLNNWGVGGQIGFAF